METFNNTITVNSVGQMGLVLTQDNAPVLAYPNNSLIPTTLCTSTLANEVWVHRNVESAGIQPRLALDAEGSLHMVYPRTTENQFRYKKFGVEGMKSRWPERQIRSASMPPSHDLAVDAQGNPVVLWLDGIERKVRVGTWSGQSFTTEEIDSEPTAMSPALGWYGKIAIGPDGAVHVAYISPGGVTWKVKRNGVWSTEQVPFPLGVIALALAVDSTGEPVILAVEDNFVRLARRNGSTFTQTTPLQADYNFNGFADVSLALDSADRAHFVATCTGLSQCSATVALNAMVYVRENGTQVEQFTVTDSASGGHMVLDSAGAPHFVWVQIREAGTPVLGLRYAHYGVTGGVDTRTVTQMVDAAGGIVNSADGLLQLEIPAGALSAMTPIGIRRLSRAELPAGADLNAPFPAYELLPSGTTFAVPALARVATGAQVMLALTNVNGALNMVSAELTDMGGTVTGVATEHVVDSFNSATITASVEHFSGLTFRMETFRIHGEVGSPVYVDHMFGVARVSVEDWMAGGPELTDRWTFLSPAASFGFGQQNRGGTFRGGSTEFFHCHQPSPAVPLRVRVSGTGVQGSPMSVDRLLEVECRSSVGITASMALRLLLFYEETMRLLVGKPTTVREPSPNPETGKPVELQGDHTQVAAVSSAVVPVTRNMAQELAMPGNALACGASSAEHTTTCPTGVTAPAAAEGDVVMVVAAKVEKPIPPPNAEDITTYTVAVVDGNPTLNTSPTAPNDPLAGASETFTYSQTNMGVSAIARRPNAARTQLVTAGSNFRVVRSGDELFFLIPTGELTYIDATALSWRLVVQRHTGTFGRGESGDLSLDVHPQVGRGYFDTAHGAIGTLDTAQPAATLELIPGDQAEQPDGGPILQELRLATRMTFPDGGSPGVSILEGSVNRWLDFYVVDGGSPNCVQQATGNGSEFLDLDQVGPGAPAVFAPHPQATNGCSVIVMPTCVGVLPVGVDGGASSGGPGAGGGGPGGPGCPPPPGGGNPPPTGTTITVNHGSLTDFFIQTPDRTCDDPEPTEYGLGRYAMSASAPAPVGMAVDLYVCARTSFGAWLRYDVFSDDNPAIVWSGPPYPTPARPDPSPRFTAGDGQFWQGEVTGNAGGGSHGFIRVNYHPIYEPGGMYGTTPDVGTITATGRSHSDTIDLRKLGTIADGTGVATTGFISAPNVYNNGESNACTGITVNGNGVNGCFVSGVSQRFDIFADVATDTMGGTQRIYIGSDNMIDLIVSGTYTDRSRIGTPLYVSSGSQNGMTRSQLRPVARSYTGGTTFPDLWIGTAFWPGTFTSAGLDIPLAGVGAHAPLLSQATFTHSVAGPVVVDVPWGANITVSNSQALGTYQPGLWRRPPAGLVAVPGSREYGRLYAKPVTQAQQVTVKPGHPLMTPGPAAQWTVTP